MGAVGILGPVPFVGGLGIGNSFHSIKKKNKNSWARHRILKSNDLIEDTGVDPIEIDIDMIFYRPYTLEPSISISILEGLSASKFPVPFIVGGTPIGRGPLTLFVIEEITSDMKKFNGPTLIYATVQVKLLEYGNLFNISGPLGALANIGAAFVGSSV